MFGTVQRCVDAYLRDHPRRGVRTDRVVTFDVTNRQIDGTCYLFFGEGASPALVAKAARTREGQAVFEIEHDNLVTLESRGLNTVRPTVPSPLGKWRDGEVLVTLQSALSGVLMKNVPGPGLFSPEGIEAAVESVYSWWLHFQDRFGTRTEAISGKRFDELVLAPVRSFRHRYLLGDDERAFLDRWCKGPNTLRDAQLPLMPRHGDFCAANMVLQESGIGVFDWEFPLRHEMPLFDLLFFFASVRFPYAGRGGESPHSESFAAVFWEESYFRDAMRTTLRRACERFEIPPETLGDLLVLSSVQVANMKYEGLLQSHGMQDLPDDRAPEEDKRARWRSFDGPDKDAPFAWIRGGVFENLGLLARRGKPEL